MVQIGYCRPERTRLHLRAHGTMAALPPPMLLIFAAFTLTHILSSAAQSSPSDLRDAGSWSTSTLQPILQFSGDVHVKQQDRVIDEIWFLTNSTSSNSGQGMQLLEWNTLTGSVASLSSIVSPTPMNVYCFDQTNDGTIFFGMNRTAIWTSKRNATGLMETATLLMTNASWSIYDLVVDRDVLLLANAIAPTSIGVFIFNLTNTAAPIQHVSTADYGCITATFQANRLLYGNRATSEVFVACTMGILVFDLDHPSLAPTLSVASLRLPLVHTILVLLRDPVSRDFFLGYGTNQVSHRVNSVTGADQPMLLNPSDDGVSVSGIVSADWFRRRLMIVSLGGALRVISIDDASVRSVLIDYEYRTCGPSSISAERGSTRLIVMCDQSGITSGVVPYIGYLNGRTLTSIPSSALCTTGVAVQERLFKLCHAQVVELVDLELLPIPINRTACPFFYQAATTPGSQILWLTCGELATSDQAAIRFVAYDTSTTQTTVILLPDQLSDYDPTQRSIWASGGAVFIGLVNSTSSVNVAFQLDLSKPLLDGEIPSMQLVYSFPIEASLLTLDFWSDHFFFTYLDFSTYSVLLSTSSWRRVDEGETAQEAFPGLTYQLYDAVIDSTTGTLFATMTVSLPDGGDDAPVISRLNILTLEYALIHTPYAISEMVYHRRLNVIFGVTILDRSVYAFDLGRNLSHLVHESAQGIALTPEAETLYIQPSFNSLMFFSDEFGCRSGFEFSGGQCTPCSLEYFQPINGNPNNTLPRCTRCADGSVAPSLGSSLCTPCNPGEFQDTIRQQQVCSVCQPSTFSNRSGSTGCDACQPGSYTSNIRSTVCVPCERGKYTSEVGMVTCTPCAKNYYSKELGSSTPCSACPAGSESTSEGGTECQQCILGAYSSGHGAPCTVCSVNSYTPHAGASACVSCNGINQDGLECNNGLAAVRQDFWAFTARDEHTGEMVYHTTRCPVGLCPGSQLQASSSAFNSSGAMNSTMPSSLIAITPACLFPRLDSPDNWLCGACAEGYLPWGSSCERCTVVDGGMMALVVLFGIALVLFLLKTGSSSAGHIAILLFFLQIASLEVGSVTRALTFLRIMNLGADSIDACLAPWTPLQQILFSLLMPFILIGILAAIGFVHWLITYYHRLHPSSGQSQVAGTSSIFQRQLDLVLNSCSVDRYVGGVMSVLLFEYTSVSLAVVKSLGCQQVAPGVRLLFSAPTISCDSSEYQAFLPVVIAWLSVYILDLPIMMLIFLWLRRDVIMQEWAESTTNQLHQQPRQLSPFAWRWGPFYRSYTAHAWYWSPLLLLRRFLFALTAVLLSSNPSGRLAVFAILHLCSLLFHSYTQPFHDNKLNRAETVSYVLLIFLTNVLGSESSLPYSAGVQAALFLLVVPPAVAMVGWIAWQRLEQLRSRPATISSPSTDDKSSFDHPASDRSLGASLSNGVHQTSDGDVIDRHTVGNEISSLSAVDIELSEVENRSSTL